MASKPNPTSSTPTLDEILTLNKNRKIILKRIAKLEKERLLTKIAAKKIELESKIQEDKNKLIKTQAKEADYLRRADAEVIFGYQETVDSGSQLQTFTVLSQQASSSSSPAYTFTGRRSATPSTDPIVESPPRLTDPLGSDTSFESPDPKVPSILVQDPSDQSKATPSTSTSSGVDSSPASGFTKFRDSFKKSQTKTKTPDPSIPITTASIPIIVTPVTPTYTTSPKPKPPTPPPAMTSTTTVIAYTPPAFGTIYNGSKSVEKFFQKYEAFANTYSWNDDIKLAQLEFHLSGPAFKCFGALKKTRTGSDFTYAKIKADLTKYFASKSSPQEYEKKLRDRKLMHNESMEQYFWDVEDLIRKVNKTVEFDKLRDHVLKGLPAEVSRDIWNSKPTDMESLIAKILEIQKFDSLMGKKHFIQTDENSVNELVNKLENLGFSVTKQTDNKEVNNYQNKKTFRKGQGNKGNTYKKSSPWKSATQSSQSQSHPRRYNQFSNAGNRPFKRYTNSNYGNKSWNSNGQYRQNNYDRDSRRYDQRSFGRPSYGHGQPPFRPNNNQNRFQRRPDNNFRRDAYAYSYENSDESYDGYYYDHPASPNNDNHRSLEQNHNERALTGNGYL